MEIQPSGADSDSRIDEIQENLRPFCIFRFTYSVLHIPPCIFRFTYSILHIALHILSCIYGLIIQ